MKDKKLVVSPRKNKIKNREVKQQQTKDPYLEKEEKRYGYRWMMAREIVILSIKRIFGEYVSATRFQTGKRDDA